ncbi:MAG: hypothetical protein K9J37_16205 [Saprospiraceae bacterium]|nr:hypothetical protein [Saprospiraceae bacterium]MCF8251457.1 hypothetical protein [Saprospiraceae bacterium]MCF8282233.1 hypothetical protein [Bacteroidales bacterium]MCF8313051.1 hypothetical protein [Saprospiraceae bacterium]MCF8441499.1 hypothetical protein [Saprospiraceae bacterium]
MQTIEIQKGVRVDIEDLINGVSRMETPVLEKFMDTMNQILTGRKSATTALREKELLTKIENIVPAFAKRRYKQLHAKLEKETISETEHQELLQIIDFMEERAVERIHLMAELAALRHVSLKELAEQIRLKKYGHASA